jgi:4'-phosphopantetheinyl transferase
MTLIAITSGRSIGVDVEKVGLMPDFERILQSYFSEEEREYVESAGSEGKIKTFLTLWTRREAAVKALGLDLSTALSQLSIPVYEPGRGIRLEHIGKGGWFLRDLQLGSTHVGAMCVEGESWGVVFHDFKESWEGGTSEISSIRAGACLSSS